MHNNIIQQFGENRFLSPSFIRSHYNLDQTGYKRAESPDEESLVHESSLNTSPVSSGYGSIDETSRTSPNENQSSVCYILSQLYDISSTYGKGQTGINVKKRSEEEPNSISNTIHEQLHPCAPDTSPSIPESSSSRPTDSLSPSGSLRSPSPSAASTTSTSENRTPKKNARTAYTNEQIQKLLKIFHENPYPESEYMERIAMDFGVAENKIKIWFQNKRARWRRRVNNNNAAAYHQQFMPTMSPMLSPVNQYGYVPHGQLMTSSPLMMPGYLNYATMLSQGNTNFQSNNGNSRLQPTHPNTPPVSQFPSMTPRHVTPSLLYSKTSPPHPSSAIPIHNGLFSHYSSPS